MTRGKLIYVTDPSGSCLVSPEFNGDMGTEMSCGRKAIEKLNCCDNLEKFKEIVIYFLKDFDYIDEYTAEDIENGSYVRERDLSVGFERGTYFENWFSDYLYIVNNTDQDITVNDYEGNEVVIAAHQLTVMDFGQKCMQEGIDYGHDEEK